MTRKEKGPDAAKNVWSAGAAKLFFSFLSFNRGFFKLFFMSPPTPRAALDNQEPFSHWGINQVGRSKTGNAGDVLIKDVFSWYSFPLINAEWIWFP